MSDLSSPAWLDAEMTLALQVLADVGITCRRRLMSTQARNAHVAPTRTSGFLERRTYVPRRDASSLQGSGIVQLD